MTTRIPNAQLMTAQDVAERLCVPASWVYEQSRRGRIPTVNVGRYRRFRREAIDTWILETERGANPHPGAA